MFVGPPVSLALLARLAYNGRKTCSTCGVEKDESEFHKRGNRIVWRCKACAKEWAAQWYVENKVYADEAHKRYAEQHKERLKEYGDQWYLENRERLIKQRRERRESNPLVAAIHGLRSMTSCALKRGGYKKRSKTFKLIGCSAEELLAKWGVSSLLDGWHIDHIVPISQAKTIEEAEKLCHHKNLQLLPAYDNMIKSDNKTEENAALCVELLGREWID